MNERENRDIAKGVILLDITKKGSIDVSNWRIEHPEITLKKCVSCGLCVTYCPEAAISINNENFPLIDLRFCKGCGICAYECPVKAIEMIKEEK